MNKSGTARLLVVLTGFLLIACLALYLLFAGNTRTDKRDSYGVPQKGHTISHRPARSTAKPDRSAGSFENGPQSPTTMPQNTAANAGLQSEGHSPNGDASRGFLENASIGELLRLAEDAWCTMSSEELRKKKHELAYSMTHVLEHLVNRHDRGREKISKEFAMGYIGDRGKPALLRCLMLYICGNREMLKKIPEMSQLAIDLAGDSNEDRDVRSFAALLLLEVSPCGRPPDQITSLISGFGDVVRKWVDGGVFKDIQVEPPQPSLKPDGRVVTDYDFWNAFPYSLQPHGEFPLFAPWGFDPADPNHKKLVELARTDKDIVFRMILLQGFRYALAYGKGDGRRKIVGLMGSLFDSDENEAIRALAAIGLGSVPMEFGEEAIAILNAHKTDQSEMVTEITRFNAAVLSCHLRDYRQRAEDRAARKGTRVNSDQTGGTVK